MSGWPAWHAAAAAAVSVACAAALGACSDDGRELRPPSANQTTTAPTTSTTAPTIAPLAFSSTAFAAGSAIPAKFTCDGDNVSPPLTWSNVPAEAAEVGIVVTDPDAQGFVHWVIARIDASITGIAEGEVPQGAVQGRNDTGSVGWFGPCPPSGTHSYVFTLYAADSPVIVDPDTPPLDAAAALQESAIATATFTATYARGSG
jgi:Raf kinase inhibitor-like YbhB/YbcL family protein